MVRLISFLFAATLAIGGFLFVDFTLANRSAGARGDAALSVGQYLTGFGDRLSGVKAGGSNVGLPSALAAMMPKPPKGWTVRPAEPNDADIFKAKSPTKETKAASAYLAAVATNRPDSIDQVAFTYERGDRRVIFQAFRYADAIFASDDERARRLELQMLSAKYRPAAFMTVRGLDVTEDLLPKGIRARYFMANIGAQIQIRVLASQRMSDEDLLAFFQTLHIKALNASVVDKVAGLGDVPVIVVASALDDATREAYDAERAARAEAEAAIWKAELLALKAEAPASDAVQIAADADNTGVVKTTEGKLKGEGRLELQGGKAGAKCEARAGTKFCTVAPAEGG